MSIVSNHWTKVSGIFGLTAVILGAYGAHGLKDRTESMKDAYKVASNYHFIHTLALGLSSTVFIGRKRTIVCLLFTSGIIFFSGSCYTVALMNQRQPYSNFAPIGGFLLMGGWIAFGFL